MPASGYPLVSFDYREVDPGYSGNVFIWDVDKTYLNTAFSTLRGLARIPVEFAVDKRAIPGMPEVLRGLRKGPGPAFACAPVYFVSASPPWMRGPLERRMQMDGVEFDGLTFKDWARCVSGLRPGRLLQQVGFKVCALLDGRMKRPESREFLFGDDAESDASAFHLYARLVSGDLDTRMAEGEMIEAGMARDDRRCARELIERIGPGGGKPARAFIHLVSRTPPDRFRRMAPFVVPVRNSFQLAAALLASGLVGRECVRAAARALAASKVPFDLEAQSADAVKRGLTGESVLREALAPLQAP